jgi:hypothetical protein
MRDYFDWIGPYVNPECFAGRDYLEFWVKDVRLADLPYNTVGGLAEYFQLFQNIKHSDFMDRSHSTYLCPLTDLSRETRGPMRSFSTSPR